MVKDQHWDENRCVLIAVLYIAGSYVEHLSNNNPQFCGLCHVMQRNVTSDLNGPNLDHVHQQARVQCKHCHIPLELSALRIDIDAQIIV